MTEYHAFSGIDDAAEKTKTLLWPFKWGIWWRIALISLFVGGFGGINFPFSFNGNPGSEYDGLFSTGLPTEFYTKLLLLIAVIIVVSIIFTLISSIFQFVFVKCLAENEFRLKNYFFENIGRGLRLFAFWLVLTIFIIAIAAGLFLALFSGGSPFNFIMLIPAILLFLLVILIFGIFALLTVDFVVPIMLKDECGVIEGWKKCWTILRNNPGQSVVYIIIKIVISIVVAIILAVAVLLIVLAIGIPFFVLFSFLGTAKIISTLNLTLLALFLVIVVPLILLVSVPFTTFLREYSLDVLGKLSPDYRLVEPESTEEPACPACDD